MRSGLIGYFIGLFFAVYWLNVGASAIGGQGRWIVLVCGTILLCAAAWRMWSRNNAAQTASRFSWRLYVAAVVAEVVALNLAAFLLPQDFFRAYQAPVIGAIVGLHFIGLWLATRMRRFLALSTAMTALNLAALMLPPTNAPTILAGLGSSAALAATVAA